jgi:2-hydroxychromene-2-carboxylate isomerase
MVMPAEFLFDVGSPHSYIAHKRLPEIETRTGVQFTYTPVLLGGIFKATNNRAPSVAFGGIPNKLAYESLELERYVKKYEIAFKLNPHFMLNTLQMMRVVTGAQLDGALRPCLDAIMHAMWGDPKKLDDEAVLRAVLLDAGLDAERLMARAQESDVKATLIERTEGAAARGAFGVPTFFIGGAMFFGKDRLPDIEDELLRVKRKASHARSNA